MKAFIGHSFDEDDKPTIRAFKEYFDALKKTMNFDWDNAEEAEVKGLSGKVKEKMKGKQLFIGILTKKQLEINEKALSPSGFFSKNECKAKKDDFRGGTSYWIIQESGYAIGKDMAVLFLIENGIRKIEGLHSDAQFIPFTRKRESECFKSLAQALGNMLNTIEGKKVGSEIGQVSATPKDEEGVKAVGSPMDKKKKGKGKENKTSFTEEDYTFAIYKSLRDKDDKKFDELKEAVFEKHKGNKEKTAEWQARILHYKSLHLQENILGSLRELRKNNEDNAYISYYIGYELKKYGSLKSAAEEYLRTASLEKNRERKLNRTYLASVAYAEDNQREPAISILLDELSEELPEDEKCKIYDYLSDVTKILKENELFVVFSEKTLSLDPSNNSLRFDLARKYSDMDKAALSLYHYKILTKNNPDSANLNNQGVAYSELKELPAKEANSYKKASEKGSTIAMGNLAQKLLNEGFLEEANEKIKKARLAKAFKESDTAKPLARLSSIPEGEEKREKEILESVKKERQFSLEYAEAYSTNFELNDTLSGEWASKHGVLKINLKPGTILSGENTENIPESDFIGSWIAGLAAAGAGPEKKPTFSKKTTHFEGTVVKNRVLEYKIKVEIQPSNQYSSKTTTKFSGTCIIDKEMSSMKMSEFDKDKKQTIYSITKQ